MHTAPPRNYESRKTKLYPLSVDISNSSKNQHYCERNIGQIRRYQTDSEEQIRSHKIKKSYLQFILKQTIFTFLYVSSKNQ